MALGFNAFPQGKTWSKVIDIGVIGHGRLSWLLNSNVSNSAGHVDYVTSTASGAGLRVQYFGAGVLGAGFEVNYATLNQKYKSVNSDASTGDYESKTTLKALDLPVFIKLGSSEGGYFELGCQFSFINDATHETTYNPIINFGQFRSGDVSDQFEDMYIAPFLGFGGSFNLMNEVLLLTAGLRFTYGVTDLVGVDGLGQPLNEDNSATYSDLNPYGYDEYKPTNPLYGTLMLGLIYSIAIE
jgi:hypothetical protein